MRAFLACFLALAACSSDSDNTSNPPPPGDDMPPDGSDMPPPTTDPSLRQDYDDTASIIATQVNLAEIAGMKASVDLSYGRVPAGMVEDVAGGLASGTGSVSGTLAGLAYSLAFECHDPAHVAVPCNGAEDHVRVVVKYSGATSGANMSMDGINEKGVFYVRYVNVPTPMFGGTGTTSFTSTLMTGVYTVSYTEASIHLQFDPNAPALPSMGTDDFTLTIHRTRDGAADRDFNVSAHLEVTGDDAATLTLDGSEVYNVTLSTGVYTVSYQESSAHLLFDSVAPVLPASGTYDLTLTMHRSGREGAEDRDFNVSAHLEVTGADAAVLTLDNQEVYNLTLSTGVAVHQ